MFYLIYKHKDKKRKYKKINQKKITSIFRKHAVKHLFLFFCSIILTKQMETEQYKSIFVYRV